MRIMLISPPRIETIESSIIHLIHEQKGNDPPLGLLYIASSIKNNSDHEVKVLDASIDKLSVSEIGQEIKDFKADIIGMTLSTFSLLECIAIAKLAKEIDPKIKVIVGGIHAYIYPRETIMLGCFDYCVLGEAEHSIIALLNSIEKGICLSGIKGIVYKEGDNTIETGLPDLITDLDSIPFPDRTLLPYKKYNSLIAKANPVSIMITSRGCPFKCIFCERPHLGKYFRVRSAENVVDEFEECCRLGIKEIMIYDDTFTVDHKRVVNMCKMLINRKVKIYWGIRARVNDVNEEMLKLLKKAGCVRIQYGVESGNAKILEGLKKGITLKEAEKAFVLTKENGIATLAYFMIGCPGDTFETIEETLQFAKKIKPTYSIFSIMMPFPATKVYADAMERGLIKKDIWKEYAVNPSKNFAIPMYEENFTKNELIVLLNKCNRDFYLRPYFIVRELFKLEKPSQLYKKIIMVLKLLYTDFVN